MQRIPRFLAKGRSRIRLKSFANNVSQNFELEQKLKWSMPTTSWLCTKSRDGDHKKIISKEENRPTSQTASKNLHKGFKRYDFDNDYYERILKEYSHYTPSPLSLNQLLEFGTKTGNERESYEFLRKELCVRLANIAAEFNHLNPALLSRPSVKQVQSWYQQSFMELEDYVHKTADDESNLTNFTEDLAKIKNRHSNVVETMAQGMVEMEESHGPIDDNVQYFLNRFYSNRIGIRMLITQHIMLYGSQLTDHPRHIGCIDPNCDVLEIVESAFEDSRNLCEAHYLIAPEMEDIAISNPYEKNEDIHIVYVPSHLRHMLFELFKNAMRAVVEYHHLEDVMPKLSVTVAKGKQDVTIKISDLGGGIPYSKRHNLFRYMYSTAPRPDYVRGGQAPLAGYGYGLPLSRLYAQYFQGDLTLCSVEGFGTDAYIYLKVLSRDANEVIPVYNKTVTKFYESDQMVSDWSSPHPWNSRKYCTLASQNCF